MAHLSQEEQLKLITDLEIEMMADMYNRYGSGYQAMQSKYRSRYRSRRFCGCITERGLTKICGDVGTVWQRHK